MDIASLWDFDDAEASEARFRVAAAAATEADERSVLMTQVARALGLCGDYEAGHAVLDSLASGGAEVDVRIALERGRLFRSSGDEATALPLFRAAAESAASSGLEGLELDALHMIPLCLTGDERLTASFHAIECARTATTPEGRQWLASLLNNLGMDFADAGDWSRAIEAFEEALAERREREDEDATFVARWMVAWALRNLGRTDEARNEQLALRADLAAAGKSERYVEEELELLG